MKRSPLMVAVLVLGSTFASVAAAADFHRATPVQGRALSDGRWEVRQVESLRERLVLARKHNDRAMLRSVDVEFERYLAAELRETQAELARARVDERVETREARGSRRGSERADVREARAEVREQSREKSRLLAIQRELKPLVGRYDRSSLSRKEGLLAELVQRARAEVRRG